MRGRTLLVVAAVVLAGCGGAGLPGGTPAPGTPTPAHVAAPGVTGEGVVDPAALAAAHRASLAGRSYTLRVVTVLNRSDGHRARVVEVRRVAADGEQTYEARFEGEFPERVLVSEFFRIPDRRLGWSNGSRTYLLEERGDDRTYFRGAFVLPLFDLFDAERVMRTYFAGADRATVTRIEHDGWIAYRIVATDEGNATSPADDVRASAVVDTFGLVHEVHVDGPAGTTSLFRGGGRVSISLRYTAIGETNVTRPAWVEEARETLESREGTASEG